MLHKFLKSVLSLMAVVLVNVGANANDFNTFANSREFQLLELNFGIKKEQLNQSDFEQLKNNGGNNGVKSAVISLTGVKAQLWLYKKVNGDFVAFYENLEDYSVRRKSTSTIWTSSKNRIMDLQFTPIERNGTLFIKYSIDRVYTVTPNSESYLDCVARVYQIAKKACESSALCDMLCDVNPGCHTSMMIASAYECL